MFDERFARQYRYELPSEFPLTSPYTGIVHHLSGPKNDALTQTFPQRVMVGRCCASLAPLTFIPRAGFSTTTLAPVLDSLVRVSRRVGKNHFDQLAQSPSGRPAPSQHGPDKSPSRTASGTGPPQLASRRARSDPRPQAPHLPRRRIHFYRFRLNDFKSFNFLSKVLFIFPSQYLFAIGFPHLFSLRRSLSPALCTSIKVHDSLGPSRTREDTTDGALTLFGGPLVDTSAPPLPALATVLQITIRRPLDRRLPVWAFPASVARTKGILVSFFSSA